MQLKATDHLRKGRAGDTVLVRLDRRDILAWIAEAYPVILVLYEAAEDRAYWLSIQDYFTDKDAFARLRGKTVTVHISTANIVGTRAMREFARQKAQRLAPGGKQP